MQKKPLILRFKIPGNRFFIYDTLKNVFFEVDNVIYDILEHYKILSNDEIIKKLSKKYSREELEKSFGIIREQEKKQGVFGEQRALNMSFSHEGEPSCYEGYGKKCDQLILEITQRCNFRCKYCIYSGLYAYQRTHKRTDMSWRTAKAAIDWFIKVSKGSAERSITFYGGEPLIKFDLIKKTVEYVKKKKLKVLYSFTTNGALLKDRKTIDYLAANDIALLISLDGPPEIHDKFRVSAGGRPTHAAIMKNLKHLYKLYPEYYSNRVYCTVTLAYNSDFPKIYEFFKKDHGFPLRLQAVSEVDATDTDFYKTYGKEPSGEKSSFSPLFAEYCEEIEKGSGCSSEILGSLFNSIFLHIHRRCRKNHSNIHMNGCCVPGQRRVFVQPNGNIHACEKIGDKYPLGNVLKGGFDMKKIKAFIGAYINLSFDDCVECPLQNLCKLCFKAAMKNGIMTTERKREECKEHIETMTRNMQRYLIIKAKNKDAFKFLEEMDIA